MDSTLNCDHYEENGWKLIENQLVSDDISLWVDEVLTPNKEGDCRLHFHEDIDGENKPHRVERFLEDHTNLHQLITTGLIPEIASFLHKSEVHIYKEKINCKMPNGAGYAPHQDAAAYDKHINFITCLIAVDDMNEDNGCIQFSTVNPISLLETDKFGCIIDTDLIWKSVSMKKGDILFFSSLLPHKSGCNHSSEMRRAIYLTYNSISDGDLRTHYYNNRIPETTNLNWVSNIGHFQGTVIKG
mgnify:FL=1